jgi:WD40 repeat protein
LQVLEGHTGPVWCLALSHSRKHLASGSRDNTARLWSMDTFEQLNVLKVKDCEVYALCFSTDDQRLFTGSGDGKHLLYSAGQSRMRVDKSWQARVCM